jgi:TrmH family RNA methyltransferase
MTHGISSPKNPRIKAALELGDAKARRARGAFAVEGAREIDRALRSGFVVLEAFFCPEALRPLARGLLARIAAAGVAAVSISPAVFAKLAVRDGSDGLIIIFAARELSLASLILPPTSLLLATEGVEKPGNLGALVRTADGAGCDAVVVLAGAVDAFNPHVVRASLGTVFHVPVVGATAEDFRAFCSERRIRIFGAALGVRSRPWFEADLRKSSAILLGSEKDGLSPSWIEQADELVQLPMNGIADSLNVGAAGAALLYEAVRQRAAEFRSP